VQAMGTGVTRRPAGWMSMADARAVAGRTGLEGIPDGPVSDLSHGDHRAIEIGVAVAGGAGLLLLDEPTAGLSPTETKAAALALRRIADEDGLTVVFVEHDMDVVFSIADQITVLDHGRLLSEGDPLHVRADEAVRDAYLGRQMEEVT
jgi:branched-chain amino acid transport system ATP-binding protein